MEIAIGGWVGMELIFVGMCGDWGWDGNCMGMGGDGNGICGRWMGMEMEPVGMDGDGCDFRSGADL